jgi:hypothetical protein
VTPEEMAPARERRAAVYADEIQRAEAGTLANLSTGAAALWLGVDAKTLWTWRQGRNPPPFVQSGTGRNAHVHYPFRELQDWNRARIQADPQEVRRWRDEAERAELQKIEADLLAQLHAVQNRLKAQRDPRRMDWLAMRQPWVYHEGVILGSAEDTPWDDADLVDLTPDEALDTPWASSEAAAPFLERVNDALDAVGARVTRLRLKLAVDADVDGGG